MMHTPLYVRYVIVLGAIALPANALRLASNRSDAHFLVHNFSGALTQESVNRHASKGLFLAGGRAPGCCPESLRAAAAPAGALWPAGRGGPVPNSSGPAPRWFARIAPGEAPFGSLVVFAVMLVLATAVLIVSMCLMMRSPPREVPACSAQPPFRPEALQSLGTTSEQDSQSERAGLASSRRMTPRGAMTQSDADDCRSDAPTEIDNVSQSPLELTPLCPQLKVPDTSKLRVVLPKRACRKRQDAVLHVCSAPQLGGRPLLRARLAECEPTAREACGIYLEALSGDRWHAFLATGDLWAEPAGATPPKLFILRPDGRQFATVEKRPGGDYAILCKLGVLATFSRDLAAHQTRVFSSQGWLMAQTEQGGEGSHEVTAFPGSDAGLVILGLLAIDKCEEHPSRDAAD